MPEAAIYALIFDGALVAVAVVALLTTLKQALRAAAGMQALDGRLAQVAMKVAPTLLGALLGLAPGLFDEYASVPRLLLGAVSGFASPQIYGLLKQRLPGLLASGFHPERAGAGAPGEGPGAAPTGPGRDGGPDAP
jgi:hypothetical protein